MKKLTFILFVFFALLSCNNPSNKNNALSFDKIEIDKKVFAFNDSTKPYMKLNLSFTYPVTSVNDTVLHRMQKIFVRAFAGEEYLAKSPKGAFDALEKECTEDAQNLYSDLGEDLDWFGDCYQNISTAVLDTTSAIVTVKSEMSSYMGGAHGSHNVYYYVINRTDGALLKEKDVLKDYSEAKQAELIKEALNEKFGTSVMDVLFGLDDVKANGNFHFTTEGMVYTFNEYEIAPYSSGMIEVVIPYAKLSNLKELYIKKQDA